MSEEEKYALIRSFSDGRTASFSALEQSEEKRLPSYLQQEVDKLNNKTRGEEYSSDKMRKKVISKVASYLGQKKLDLSAVKEFVTSVGYMKKDLNRYSHDELPKLVSQMEAIWSKKVQANRDEIKKV